MPDLNNVSGGDGGQTHRCCLPNLWCDLSASSCHKRSWAWWWWNSCFSICWYFHWWWFWSCSKPSNNKLVNTTLITLLRLIYNVIPYDPSRLVSRSSMPVFITHASQVMGWIIPPQLPNTQTPQKSNSSQATRWIAADGNFRQRLARLDVLLKKTKSVFRQNVFGFHKH